MALTPSGRLCLLLLRPALTWAPGWPAEPCFQITVFPAWVIPGPWPASKWLSGFTVQVGGVWVTDFIYLFFNNSKCKTVLVAGIP